MTNVLIMDMASRISGVGGEARMAEMLFNGLKNDFNTYYLGFLTDYISASGDDKIILKKRLPAGAWVRKSWLSELHMMRIAYNLVFVRRMRAMGLSRKETDRIKEIAPEVIISNSLADFPLLENLRSQGLKFKSIYLDHGCISIAETKGALSNASIPLTIGSGLSGIDTQEVKRKFFRSFDLNVALTEGQFSAIKKFTDRVIYIPNSSDAPTKESATGKRGFMGRYGLKESNFVVLYLGRMFERQKKVSTLIKAFKSIKDGELRLLLAGDGTSLSRYKAQAKGDTRIIFTGALDDDEVNAAYWVSDLFVLPSAWEALSLVLLEASAHSLPAILSSGAYVSDLKVKEIGRIPCFRTGDSRSLAMLIKKIYNDVEFRKAAIRSSMAVSKTFTTDRMIKRYREAVRSVL
jgi:glycosyltransferase involved in cell wall biosynthesis